MCWMSILLHWRNKRSPSNKDQRAFGNGQEVTHKSLCDKGCFQVIDYASSPFRLKVKEVLHINWLMPDLNKQKEYVRITISV